MEVNNHAFLTMVIQVGKGLASPSSRFAHIRERLVRARLTPTQRYVARGDIRDDKTAITSSGITPKRFGKFSAVLHI
jgi:hypothetical protein